MRKDLINPYVYAVFLKGIPVYVGKGKGYRAWAYTRSHNSSLKALARIERLTVSIVARNLTEHEAHFLERKIIKHHGLVHAGGTLLNKYLSGTKNTRQGNGWNKGLKNDPRFVGKHGKKQKLQEADVRRIISLYATGDYSLFELSCLHNVSKSLIGGIIRGKLWPHIERSELPDLRLLQQHIHMKKTPRGKR